MPSTLGQQIKSMSALLDVGERGTCNSMSSQETPAVLEK